ncbi:MAG: hypothetical protein H7A32_05625 [Deltaproteobacteria bacterium]|nr:hypothetical protein [Deltaproteobacteria bacterium]
MGIQRLNICLRDVDCTPKNSSQVEIAQKSTPKNASCEQIQNQISLRSVESGRAYIQNRLKKSQQQGRTHAGFTEKLGNWVKGYGYIDHGAKDSESAEFKTILDCLNEENKKRIIPEMAYHCEVPGMRSGALCWQNTQAVTETAITSGGTLHARNIASKMKSLQPDVKDIWGNLKTLEKHFVDHGADFNAKNADDYARKAWDFFLDSSKKGYLRKVDERGVTRLFDPKTNTFGSYNANGTIRTFYKPQPYSLKNPNGYKSKDAFHYWLSQPGR